MPKGNGISRVRVSRTFSERVTSTHLSLNSAHSCAGTTDDERVFSGPDRARVGMRTHRFRNCFLMSSPSSCRVTRGRLRFRGGRTPAIAALAKWALESVKIIGAESQKKRRTQIRRKIEFSHFLALSPHWYVRLHLAGRMSAKHRLKRRDDPRHPQTIRVKSVKARKPRERVHFS